ncbi:MAG: hypothetical protein JW384_01025 [Nitrosomonadaceae bacterium]|nr:hypothetical protein [Nitrosomonadaceae bacterium]
MMMSPGLCGGHKLAWVLVFIGAINWGLIGFFEYNLVNAILGSLPTIERVVYALVGLSAIFSLFCAKCSMCKTSK